MTDYTAMTDDDFARILQEIVDGMSSAELLATPGVYEALAEELNNEVLERWEDEQDEKREDYELGLGEG